MSYFIRPLYAKIKAQSRSHEAYGFYRYAIGHDTKHSIACPNLSGLTPALTTPLFHDSLNANTMAFESLRDLPSRLLGLAMFQSTHRL